MESVVANNRVHLSQRVNFRAIVFAVVFLTLTGYPVYVYVDAAISGGARETGAGIWKVDLRALGHYLFNDSTGTPSNIPEKWRELDGKKVVLEGYPYPTNDSGDLVSEFQFVYNINLCCLGGPPQVQERVFAHGFNGTKVPLYSERYCILEGTLHVRPIRNEVGKVISVYDLDVDRVTPVSN